MFDIDQYLAKIGYDGPLEPTLDTLRRLQKLHLMAVPFDNFLNGERGVGIWEGVEIDLDLTFKAVITGGRGGVCYELNGLFRELLNRIGFEVIVLSAGVRGPDGRFGPEIEHLFNGVRLDGELWLVDVGYSGPSYLEPVKVSEEVQEQYGTEFRVVESEGFQVLERRPRDGDWLAVYRLLTQPRRLSEWTEENPALAAHARELAASETLIRGRALENGQLTLTGRRFLRVEDGREQVRVLIKAADFDEVLRHVLLQD